MFLKGFNYQTALQVAVTADNAPVVSANAMGMDTIHAVVFKDNNIGGAVTDWDAQVWVSPDGDRWILFGTKDELSETSGAVVDLGLGYPYVKVAIAETEAGMNIDIIMVGGSTHK